MWKEKTKKAKFARKMTILNMFLKIAMDFREKRQKELMKRNKMKKFNFGSRMS